MKKTKVRALISQQQVCARPDMQLTDLVALFKEHSVRGLPVVSDDGRVVGVVTETDLFLKSKGVAFSLEKVPTILGHTVDPQEVEDLEAGHGVTVSEVMTESATAINPDASLWDAAKLMAERRVSILPVVEDGQWVGTVRRISILEKIYPA